MILRYLCPKCRRTVETEALAELLRSKEKVTYVCKCPSCKQSTDVSVSVNEILAKGEEQLFDRFGFSYN